MAASAIQTNNNTAVSKAMQNLQAMIREFELAYNLSPELTEAQINELREQISQIFAS
jgi:polyhydroxyalkanoate synthesis regulator phasin